MNVKRSSMVLFVSILSLTFFLGIMGCSGKTSGSASTNDTPNQSTKNSSTNNSSASKSSTGNNQERPKLLKMGEKATVGDYEVAILSAKTAAEYVNGPGEGNKYIVIRCSFKNVSKEEQRTSIGSSIQYLGADGTRRGYASTTGVKLMESKKTLAPGESAEYEEVYKVPKDKNEFEFHFVAMKPVELARWQVTVN